MNVNLSKTWTIAAILVSDRYDHPQINPYTITVTMTTQSEDQTEINVAFERMKFWFLDVMSDAVLISQDHPMLDQWANTGIRCLIFPEDPVDQLVGMMTYCKLTAMVEGRISINHVSISSVLDDHVTYHHDADDNPGVFVSDGWWNDLRPSWTNQKKQRKSTSKIINLDRQPTWKDHDLSWESLSQEDNGPE